LERVVGTESIARMMCDDSGVDWNSSGSSVTTAATPLTPLPPLAAKVEAVLASYELLLAEAVMPRDLTVQVDYGYSVMMEARGGGNCHIREPIGLYAQRHVRSRSCSSSAVAHTAAASAVISTTTTTQQAIKEEDQLATVPPIAMDYGVGDMELLLQEAQQELVFEVGGNLTTSQILRQIVNELRGQGIVVDPYLVLPPTPPPDGSVEFLNRESWQASSEDYDMGMALRFMEVVDVQKLMGRGGSGGSRVISLPPSGDGLGRPPRPTGRAAADGGWTADEDADLMRTYELYGQQPLLLSFAITRRTSAHGRKRSQLQCMKRLDQLLQLNDENNRVKNRPTPPPLRQIQEDLFPAYPGARPQRLLDEGWLIHIVLMCRFFVCYCFIIIIVNTTISDLITPLLLISPLFSVQWNHPMFSSSSNPGVISWCSWHENMPLVLMWKGPPHSNWILPSSLSPPPTSPRCYPHLTS